MNIKRSHACQTQGLESGKKHNFPWINTDWPLGQGHTSKIGNQSQDEKQQNWAELFILVKANYEQNTPKSGLK